MSMFLEVAARDYILSPTTTGTATRLGTKSKDFGCIYGQPIWMCISAGFLLSIHSMAGHRKGSFGLRWALRKWDYGVSGYVE